jgi:signal transduction histidine kinase
MEYFQRRAWLAWASVGLLAVLCAVLALLQYKWIGEVTTAERSRMRDQLQARLSVLSRNFNEEISAAVAALVPSWEQLEQMGRERAYSAQYLRWKESHERLFRRIALAVPVDGKPQLLNLDLDTGQFSPMDWPPEWSGMRDRAQSRLDGSGPSGPAAPHATLIELPRFAGPESGGPPREQEWLLLDLNLDYLDRTLLPEFLTRYLGDAGKLDYDAEVVANSDPAIVIYDSAPGHNHMTEGKEDASVGLLEIRPMMGGRGGPGRFGGFGDRGGRGGREFRGGGRGFGQGPGPPMNGGQGRWVLRVRHHAGSLEALVATTRRRNLAVSGAVLLLVLATAGLLVRLSRHAEHLAELQMNFVAGVSHELRTPLTVIRTAAFNLRGKLASRPEQVEKYGALIEGESEKLANLMDQVLRFASAQAGHAIRASEPVAADKLIDDGLRSSRAAHAGAGLTIEKRIDAGLPPVMADELALRHALQNLIDNALKYGTEGGNWIGIFASAAPGANGRAAVEIRVADRGPGIPADEQKFVFEPFFRGRRAIQDQVHGTGLGLNLVKKIVEAHGGTIRVKSEPMRGTEFIIRVPAAPRELQDEFSDTAD